MARFFPSNTGTELITYTLSPASMFTFGTMACMVNVTGGASAYRFFLGGNTDQFLFGLDSSNRIFFYNGGVDRHGTTTIGTTDGWCLVSFTKATGSVTGRFCVHKLASGAAGTFTNADSTSANPSAATSVIVGGPSGAQDRLVGHIAAAIIIQGRVLTDSEIQRMVSGRWDLWADDKSILLEWPSGRDPEPTNTAAKLRDQGRLRINWASTVGTSRSAVTDPPGFKFSRLKQRR